MMETVSFELKTMFVEVSGSGLREVDGFFVPSKVSPAILESLDS